MTDERIDGGASPEEILAAWTRDTDRVRRRLRRRIANAVDAERSGRYAGNRPISGELAVVSGALAEAMIAAKRHAAELAALADAGYDGDDRDTLRAARDAQRDARAETDLPRPTGSGPLGGGPSPSTPLE